MKNKGFTLIELLAVVTILTIILLITFASVGSVIKNSKNSLHDSQINVIEKAAEYYNNKEGLKDYDNCINVEDLIDKGYIKQDEIKDPKGGKSIEGSVMIGYSGKKYSYKYQESFCPYTYVTLLEDVAPLGLSIGDKYSYKVNNNDTFNFYVLSIEDKQVNLIMDSNICNDGTIPTSSNPCTYAWHWQTQEYDEDDNRYGPDIAMTNLYNGTKGWINVPDMIMNYEDENNKTDDTKGYTSIITDITTKITTITGKQNKTSTSQIFGNTTAPLKARLPREDEVKPSDNSLCTTSDSSCPTWLVSNLADADYDEYSSVPKVANIYGYWLLSSHSVTSDFACVVACYGDVNTSITSNSDEVGVRAVITMSKSVFDNR